jgi:hypothetical protein
MPLITVVYDRAESPNTCDKINTPDDSEKENDSEESPAYSPVSLVGDQESYNKSNSSPMNLEDYVPAWEDPIMSPIQNQTPVYSIETPVYIEDKNDKNYNDYRRRTMIRHEEQAIYEETDSDDESSKEKDDDTVNKDSDSESNKEKDAHPKEPNVENELNNTKDAHPKEPHLATESINTKDAQKETNSNNESNITKDAHQKKTTIQVIQMRIQIDNCQVQKNSKDY